MTQKYLHTLSDEEKVGFYFNKLELIQESQQIEYDKFPGLYDLPDYEPILPDNIGYEEVNSITLVDQILVYSMAETVHALIFESQEESLMLFIISNFEVVSKKTYDKLLRGRIISRLKNLALVDVAEKKFPQVGVLKLNYRSEQYVTKLLFFPQKFGDSIVICSEKVEPK